MMVLIRLLLLLLFGSRSRAAYTPAQYAQEEAEFIRAAPFKEATTFRLFNDANAFSNYHTVALFGHNSQQLSDSMIRAFDALPALANHITVEDFREAMRHDNCIPLVLYCLWTGKAQFYQLFTDPALALKSWVVLNNPAYIRLYPPDQYLKQILPAALTGVSPQQWDLDFGGKFTSNHLSDAAFTELLKHPKACKYYARHLGNPIQSHLNKLPNKIRLLSKHCPDIWATLNPVHWTDAERLFKELSVEAMRVHLADPTVCGAYSDQIINEIPFKEAPISSILSIQCILALNKRLTTKHTAERIHTLPKEYFEHIDPNIFHDHGIVNRTFLHAMSAEQLFIALRREFMANPDFNEMTADQVDELVGLIAKLKHCRLLREVLLQRASPKVYKGLEASCWSRMLPTLKLKLSSAQLAELPSQAWSDIHGDLLHNCQISESDSVALDDSRIKSLIGKMGSASNPIHRLKQHGCYNPIGLFKALPGTAMSFTDACIKHTKPSAIAILTSDQLNGLPQSTVRSFTAAQVAAIPTELFADLTDEFLLDGLVRGTDQSKSQSKRLSCSGFRLEQLLSITSTRFWPEMSGTCVLHWSNDIWMGLPEEQLKRAPPRIFKRWLMPPDDDYHRGTDTVAHLLEAVSPEQLAVLGASHGAQVSRKRHPCWNVEFGWTKLGGTDHQDAMQQLPPACFAYLAPSVLGGMEEGDFGQLADNILAEMDDPKRFAQIPVQALEGLRPAHLEHMLPILCSVFEERHLELLQKLGLTEHLDPACLYRIKPDLLAMVFKSPLPEDALRDLDRDNLRNLSFLQTIDGEEWKERAAGTKISPQKLTKGEQGILATKFAPLDLEKTPPLISSTQWSHLGMRDVREGILRIHPCEVIRKEHVVLGDSSNFHYYPPTLQAFWQGINPHCFAALLFLGELTERELSLVPDSAFATLTDYQVSLLRPALGASAGRLEIARNCKSQTAEYVNGLSPLILSTVAVDCFGQWDPGLIGGLQAATLESLSDQFYAFLSLGQLAALPPDAMNRIRPENWKVIGQSTNGISCAGFTTAQAAHLPTQWLETLCTANLEPAIFGRLSTVQLNHLNAIALSRYISAKQISAVQPNVLGEFGRFAQLGSDWTLTAATAANRSLKDHPCNGVTEEQQRAMSLSVRTDFERQCLPVLAKIENVGSRFGVRTGWLWILTYALLMASVLLG